MENINEYENIENQGNDNHYQKSKDVLQLEKYKTLLENEKELNSFDYKENIESQEKILLEKIFSPKVENIKNLDNKNNQDNLENNNNHNLDNDILFLEYIKETGYELFLSQDEKYLLTFCARTGLRIKKERLNNYSSLWLAYGEADFLPILDKFLLKNYHPITVVKKENLFYNYQNITSGDNITSLIIYALYGFENCQSSKDINALENKIIKTNFILDNLEKLENKKELYKKILLAQLIFYKTFGFFKNDIIGEHKDINYAINLFYKNCLYIASDANLQIKATFNNYETPEYLRIKNQLRKNRLFTMKEKLEKTLKTSYLAKLAIEDTSEYSDFSSSFDFAFGELGLRDIENENLSLDEIEAGFAFDENELLELTGDFYGDYDNQYQDEYSENSPSPNFSDINQTVLDEINQELSFAFSDIGQKIANEERKTHAGGLADIHAGILGTDRKKEKENLIHNKIIFDGLEIKSQERHKPIIQEKASISTQNVNIQKTTTLKPFLKAKKKIGFSKN